MSTLTATEAWDELIAALYEARKELSDEERFCLADDLNLQRKVELRAEEIRAEKQSMTEQPA